MTQRFVVGLAAVALLLSGAARARAEYIVTDLGTLPGGWESSAQGISDAGQVVGYASTFGAQNQHAFLYSGGHLIDLGTPISGGFANPGSWAWAINAAGNVALSVPVKAPPEDGVSVSTRAFVYSWGTMTDLGTLGGYTATAMGINEHGQVVGTSTTKAGIPHAYLYDSGKMTDLGTLPGGSRSYALAINNAGQVTGSASTSADPANDHAMLYSTGKITDLGTLGGSHSVGLAINGVGTVVGFSDTGNGTQHAFVSSGGKMTDLGSLTGAFGSSIAKGINNAGQVVGQSWSANGNLHAFLFIDGKMTDLNSLIAKDSSWILNSANAINNMGQIVGYGTNPAGQTHAFLLTPTAEVPEPGSLALFGLGALGLAGHAWRKRRRAGT